MTTPVESRSDTDTAGRTFKRSTWILLLLLLILAFAFQGSRSIYSPDEGYYVSIARAMVQSGDYMVPRLNHVPWYDKPPLSLWGIAGGLIIFGQNEWGARFFHGLSFLLTALIVLLIGKSLGSMREGVLSAILYATMLLPFAAGNIVTPDTPLVLWTTLAFFAFWKSVEPSARHVALWKMVMCAAFGLGFLTKGPAALIPAGAMFLFLLLKRRTVRYFLTPWAFAGLGLFSILGLGWYAWTALHIPGTLHYFLDNQLIGRTISAKYARNASPDGALLYLPVLLLGALPWPVLWFKPVKRMAGRIFRREAWRSLLNDPPRLFLALWICVPLVVLMLAKSRLPLYVLPLFPGLALITTRLLPVRTDRRSVLFGFSRAGFVALGCWVIILIGIKVTAARYPSMKDMRALHAAIQPVLPDELYKVVCMDEHLEGLAFYDVPMIERVTTSSTPYPFFVLPEQLEEEVREIRTTRYAHLFICKKTRIAKEIRRLLRKAGLPFEETSLPFHRHLITVKPYNPDP